jgi:predicted lysophospholipase L1 biosynthesis ABC-type transport system permease subunit
MVERHWPVVYRPLAQAPLYHPAVKLHVRLAQPSETALRAVQAALRTGLGQAARALRPVEGDLADRFVAQRFNALALNVFAGFGLLLAAMGIYGNVAYGITRRTREIGVRSALGADRSRILRLVAGQATRVAVTGTALGLVASLGLVRALAPLLSATSGAQPWLFVGAGVAVCAVASFAAYLPARKATAIDPMVALRAD